MEKEMVTKTEMKKMMASKEPKPMEKKYMGKGTRARLNTIAEKHFFKSRVSK